MNVKKISILLVLFVFSFLFIGTLNVEAASTDSFRCVYENSNTVELQYDGGNNSPLTAAYFQKSGDILDSTTLNVDRVFYNVDGICPTLKYALVDTLFSGQKWILYSAQAPLTEVLYNIQNSVTLDGATAKIVDESGKTRNTNETPSTLCNEEQEKILKANMTSSSDHGIVESSYNARITKIVNFDYDLTYKEYIKSGMTSAQAAAAINAIYNKFATDSLDGEENYISYIQNQGSVNNENCTFDVAKDWYTTLLSYPSDCHEYLNNIILGKLKEKINKSTLLTDAQKTTYLNLATNSNTENNTKNDVARDSLITKTYAILGLQVFGESVHVNCSIFTTESIVFLNKILGYLKIFVPILVIILGALDFGQAVLSNDKDFLNKAVSKFIKRCIVAVGFFFLPVLLSYLLNLLPGTDDPLCGVGFIIFQLIKF